MSQPGAGAAAATDPSPSPSPAPPPPVVEWPEGGALTRDWAAALASTLDWCSRHLPADRLPSLLVKRNDQNSCKWRDRNSCAASGAGWRCCSQPCGARRRQIHLPAPPALCSTPTHVCPRRLPCRRRLRPPPDSLIFLPAACFACPCEEGHGCTAVQRCWPPSRLNRHRCHQEHSIMRS
ncbi:serine/threonine-protein phosphatase 7 [Panicum miliaceum]|uniref:Serine/threonine-protein phosphatase 7 n=1 Tax=Panicum miliaceum TaxID=4540 RepID=A0A3L6PQV8_PANMI|nr:serine/threonine-protein phosphatase 7 [Panicum miliaceum]